MRHDWTKYVPSAAIITLLSIAGVLLVIGIKVWNWGG